MNNYYFKISANKRAFNLGLKEINQYKDLLVMFVRRDIISVYKQTVLGPLWFFISPILSSITQYWVFGKLAKFPSDGTPYFLFILAGNILWGYFANTLNGSSNTFRTNQSIFGKVYFPRAIVPLSLTISNLFQFFIKLMLLVVVIFGSGLSSNMTTWIFTLPLLIIVMALISMGIGMLISSLTIKYRDFSQLMSFLVGLSMYITPVIYPTTMFLDGVDSNKHYLIYLNPLTSVFDAYRYAFFGTGNINLFWLSYSVVFAVTIYIIGLVVFNYVEKTFIDNI